jgi:serine protease
MTSAHKTALATTILTLALAGSHSTSEAQGPPGRPQEPPGQERRRYVLEFNQFGPDASDAVRALGGEIAHEFPQFRMLAAWLPEAARTALQNNPNVSSIEEDPQRFPLADTKPYGISMVQADQVSDAGASNRKVCIIDSGYSLGHPDLPLDVAHGGSVTGVNDSGAGLWSQDGCGHGTHVAGTIAALGNGLGVLGVLPGGGISLHIVRVFGNNCGWAYASDLAAALNQCRVAGANVVNMSLGGSVSSTLERNAFDNAYAAGVLSIAAAGNAGNTAISYPAGYNSVVSVAAVDQNKALASFSQRNADVELAAPGVGVLSTVPWQEQNSLTVGGSVYNGIWMEFAARTTTTGVTGILANGGLCESAGSWGGRIVVCQRGNNTFASKVANVQAGGGVAAVIYNNVPGDLLGTLGSASSTPAIGITQTDGEALIASRIGQVGTFVSFRDETGGGYEAWDGTSMATPHVAGVAALIWSYYPNKTAADVRNALDASAEDLGPAGRDTSFGFGLVRAQAALDALANGSQPPPQPPPVNIVLSATRRGKRVDLSWSGATSSTMDIFRTNQLLVGGTANDGSYSDTIPGKGTYAYTVCQAGTATCSNTVTVVF